jgi:YidC/Oxa1 family membrane protein insertase
MTELQTKYKNNPEKLNQEMAKLYQETGYNPVSGCLPMFIQLPLVIAMFNLFNNYFEFRGAMFIPGWIPDLSVGDSIYTLKFNLPFLGNQIRLLPVIYLASQLIYSKITSATSGGANATQMKIMMYAMPLVFFFVFYSAPSGLLIYWTISNLLQLVQQTFLNKLTKSKKVELEQKKK